MKTRLSSLLLGLIAMTSFRAPGQGTAFTYQGRLNDNGNAANGNYDLQFYLRDALVAGNPVGVTNRLAPAAVSSGVFTVTLDFGANIFDGSARWLEIGVRTNGSTGAYTTLSPRQPVTPTPYAVYAANAGIPDSAITSAKLADGAVTSTKLADASVTAAKLSTAGATAGQILKYNGTQWAAAADNDTTYSADAGLTLNGTSFSVNFAGSGSVTTASRSDHDHLGGFWIGNGGLGVWNTNTSGRIGPPVSLNGFSLADGTGVRGSSSSGTGVDGSSDSGYGVSGLVTTGTQNAGVYGKSTAVNGSGVLGQADSGNNAYGVWGKAAQGKGVVGESSSGYGVYGKSGSSALGVAGVYGTSTITDGNGVIGEANGSNAYGVWGKTTSGTAVRGDSQTGRAVDGLSSNGGVGVYGNNLGSNTKGYAGDFFGRVRVDGDLVLQTERSGGAIKVTGAGVGTSTPVFIHRATAANVGGYYTRIDHPLTNGDPNAILIVTPNGNAGTGFYYHPVSVNYVFEKWVIVNADATDMQPGAAFNVLVVKP